MASPISVGDVFHLRYVRGDRVVRPMALREPDRTTPIDITGWTWLAQVRDEPDSTAILVTLTVTVTSAPQGELTVTMNEADSDDQALYGTYWDLQRVLPYPLTYVRGRLFPKKDVSRTP